MSLLNPSGIVFRVRAIGRHDRFADERGPDGAVRFCRRLIFVDNVVVNRIDPERWRGERVIVGTAAPSSDRADGRRRSVYDVQ